MKFSELSPQAVTIMTTLLAVVVIPIIVWLWRQLQEARNARLLKVFSSRDEMVKAFDGMDKKRDRLHEENKEALKDFLDTIKEEIGEVKSDVSEVHDRVDNILLALGKREWSGEERRGKGPRGPSTKR